MKREVTFRPEWGTVQVYVDRENYGYLYRRSNRPAPPPEWVCNLDLAAYVFGDTERCAEGLPLEDLMALIEKTIHQQEIK